LEHHAAALAGLYGWQLTIPLIDERAGIFDTAQVEQLWRQRILTNTVGIGFALRARRHGLGVAFGFGDFLRSFRLRGG
jgi:hypothetical protein